MSLDQATERQPEKTNGQEVHAPSAPGPAAAEAAADSAVATFRKEFHIGSQPGLLRALGEEPEEYQRMMESLLEDLQPRAGLESHLVEQIGETFWRMRRAQHMRDGLAQKRIQDKVMAEQMAATMQASRALETVEPFERLGDALSRQREGPTAAEIAQFVESRKGDSSGEMQEFIVLLESLQQPMEERQRRAARQKARNELQRLMDPLQNVAMHFAVRCQQVQSPENRAALMAMDDEKGAPLQRMEDSQLRRLWRLTNCLAKVRQGVLQKKDVKNDRTNPECA
jgi:hypothetical protein